MLADALGPETLVIREPGGTPVGERIRALLKDPSLPLDPAAELMLFGAARAELCNRVVAPAIDAKRDIVCDRFIDSTAAYQGIGRGLGLEMVELLNAAAIGSCVPDLTVLLRIDPDAAAARGQRRLAMGGEDGDDRFESEGPQYQRMVAAAYDRIASDNPERIAVIDAIGDPAEVHELILGLVQARRG